MLSREKGMNSNRARSSWKTSWTIDDEIENYKRARSGHYYKDVRKLLNVV
jgi:hypothetical protein